MGNNSGYVYVMINPSYGEGVVKIGKTTKEPEERAKELSSATGVVTPFILVYKRLFKNCHTAERLIHSILEGKGHRVNTNREFFAIGIPEAINYIMQLPDEDEGDEDYYEDELQESNEDLADEYFRIAEEYANGSEDTFQDSDLAIEYYEKSAALGKVEALHCLGMLWRYDKNQSEKALQCFHNAVKKGYWRSYGMIAALYGEEESRCYNPSNSELAWKKYWEQVKLHNSELGYYDWYVGDIASDFLKYLYEHLDRNKPIPTIIDELALEHRVWLVDALKAKIEWFENNGFQLVGNAFQRHIGKYLDGIEEKMLLSEAAGDNLAKNYFIVAEKYFYGNEGYEKNEYKALRYWKESSKLGYYRAYVNVGMYWLTQSKHIDPVKEAWKAYYNSVYDRVADDEIIVSEEEKQLIIEGFYEMFHLAKCNDAEHLLEDYFFMMALQLGMTDYITDKVEMLNEMSDEVCEFEDLCIGDEEASIDDVLADSERLLKSIEYKTELDKATTILTMIKEFFADFMARNTDPNPQMHRL